MAKYLVIASYTTEGVRGVVDKGGSARRKAVQAAVKDLGGKVEAFYFGFGADDAYVIIDLPGNVEAAALGLNVAASGMVNSRVIVLLTPEEIDQATSTAVSYRPPGG